MGYRHTLKASKDMVVIHDSQGSKLDPSTDNGLGSKTGFDCTIPLNSEPMRYKRITIPGYDELNLQDYLSHDASGSKRVSFETDKVLT